MHDFTGCCYETSFVHWYLGHCSRLQSKVPSCGDHLNVSFFSFLKFQSSLWAQGSSCSVQTSNFKAFSWIGLAPRWYLEFRELWVSGLCWTLAKNLKFSVENWLCMCNLVSEYDFQVRINQEAHLGFEGAQGILCARENPFWGKAGDFSIMSKASLKNEKQSQHFV